MKSYTFVDTVVLHAFAGNGGHGCVGFRREKFVPKGGPDGGDGGHGGNVILRGNRDVTSLVAIYYTPHQRAKHGGPGRGKRMHGRNGEDCIVPVPCGTEVYAAETGEILGDIVEHDQELVVARGGKGGLGNYHWKSSTNQAPIQHTEGIEGESIELRLTLKLMADAGLVGFPNAGKSSLLTALSDAHPKVGAYPFTTLHPIIGTLLFPDYTRMTLADIPGLIKGAHEGVGLGHAFLRHIERAPHLIYVLDVGGVEHRNPIKDYQALQDELRLHKAELAERESLVVANKIDLPDAAERLKEFREATGIDPIPVSALSGEGIPRLKTAIHDLFLRTRASAD